MSKVIQSEEYTEYFYFGADGSVTVEIILLSDKVDYEDYFYLTTVMLNINTLKN